MLTMESWHLFQRCSSGCSSSLHQFITPMVYMATTLKNIQFTQSLDGSLEILVDLLCSVNR